MAVAAVAVVGVGVVCIIPSPWEASGAQSPAADGRSGEDSGGVWWRDHCGRIPEFPSRRLRSAVALAVALAWQDSQPSCCCCCSLLLLLLLAWRFETCPQRRWGSAPGRPCGRPQWRQRGRCWRCCCRRCTGTVGRRSSIPQSTGSRA